MLRVLMVCMGVVFLLSGIPLQAQNLLKNPSFEEPEDSDNWESDHSAAWERWGMWMNREIGWVPRRTGEGITGYHHWEVIGADSSGLFQDVEGVPALSECQFSIHALIDEMTDIEELRLRLEPLGGGDPYEAAVIEGDEISTVTWDYLAISGVNTRPGVRVVVEIIPSGNEKKNGALKLDDAELRIEQ
ncbi:MAG: hypothetical protein EOM20_06550 [Spartobacteria bacterium]|nr:hypothetical protein [Spartobacteria bacterium]